VRWGPIFVGVLGAAAACNSLLGYDQNYGLAKDASVDSGGQDDGASDAPEGEEGAADVMVEDGAVDEGSEGAREANVPDAVDEDAAAPAGDAGQDADEGGAGADSSTLGVPCGAQFCSGGYACCFKPPAVPGGCALAETCSVIGQGYVLCDGPEDCDGGACCVSPMSPGVIAVTCVGTATCPASFPKVCHLGAGDCACKANPCYPVPTCDGRCM
jgi:hypothetical protein